jgi:hypothetical protein
MVLTALQQLAHHTKHAQLRTLNCKIPWKWLIKKKWKYLGANSDDYVLTQTAFTKDDALV